MDRDNRGVCSTTKSAKDANVESEQVPPEDARHGVYAALMASYQGRLRAYIIDLVSDVEAAADVLQETNIVLLKRWQEFEPGTNFNAWSFRIAHLQVLAHWRRKSREKLEFDDDLLARMAVEARRLDDHWTTRELRLNHCIGRLDAQYREILRLRYIEELSISELASRLNRSENAVSQLLFRLRQRLVECIKHTADDERTRPA